MTELVNVLSGCDINYLLNEILSGLDLTRGTVGIRLPHFEDLGTEESYEVSLTLLTLNKSLGKKGVVYPITIFDEDNPPNFGKFTLSSLLSDNKINILIYHVDVDYDLIKEHDAFITIAEKGYSFTSTTFVKS